MTAGRLINTHDQLVAAGGGVALTKARTVGRTSRFCGWSVFRMNERGKMLVTNRGAAWYEYGCKVFYTFGHDDALAAAKAWVAEQYGERGPWKRNLCGDYVPERIAKAHPIRREKAASGAAR